MGRTKGPNIEDGISLQRVESLASEFQKSAARVNGDCLLYNHEDQCGVVYLCPDAENVKWEEGFLELTGQLVLLNWQAPV